MVVHAGVGANPARIQEGHEFDGVHVIERERDDAFAFRIVGTGNDGDAGNFGEAAKIARAVRHGMAELLLVVMNGLCRRFDAGAAVRAFGEAAAEPDEILHHIGEGGVASGIAGAEFPGGGAGCR